MSRERIVTATDRAAMYVNEDGEFVDYCRPKSR